MSSYGALSSWFCVVTHKRKIFIRLLDNASRWGWIIDGLVHTSGTGQAFNSLSCWVSYPVTKGHCTNTQRNDVLRRGGQRQEAENKIKEACILYATVGISHSKRETWQQRKTLPLQKPLVCFWSIEEWYGGCVFVAYICWFLWERTQRSTTLFCRGKCFKLGPFVNTGCSGWDVKLLLLAGFFCSKWLLKCRSCQNWINYLIDRWIEIKLEAIWSDQSSSHCGISFIHPTHSFQLLPPGHFDKFYISVCLSAY